MGAVSTSKRSSAGKNVLVFFIVFIILEMLIVFGIGKVFKNKDVTPSIMGYSLFMTKEDLVQNAPGGNAQVIVPKNVLVIASDGLPDPTNKIGCAILCENIDGVGAGVFWLADMTPREKKDGVDYTVTNGTQAYVIESSNIVGVCASYFETAGKVIGFVTQKFGMICCAVVPLFLLVLIELVIAIATHSSDDDEYEDEDEDEDEEEDKSVELDDFLFGGQSEGEQIAKRRKKALAAAEETEEEEDEAPAKPAEAPKPVKKAMDDDFDFEVKRPSVKEDAAEAEAPAEADVPDAPEEKPEDKQEETAPQTAATVSETPAEEAPAETPARPARRQGARPAARRRRPAGGVSTSDASLEDLMKLMEEEQNKLRNKMN